MTISVTHSTLADDTFSATGALAWDAGHNISGFGTMALQDASAVAITGGIMDGVPIGANVARPGNFTDLVGTSGIGGGNF